jgi:hypothetical protein
MRVWYTDTWRVGTKEKNQSSPSKELGKCRGVKGKEVVDWCGKHLE